MFHDFEEAQSFVRENGIEMVDLEGSAISGGAGIT
jgi:hypothetical protein